jgi:hypothetical protein
LTPTEDLRLEEFVVPEQPSWLFECDGLYFDSLSKAEAFSMRTGANIYCRLTTRRKKAVNQ